MARNHNYWTGESNVHGSNNYLTSVALPAGQTVGMS